MVKLTVLLKKRKKKKRKNINNKNVPLTFATLIYLLPPFWQNIINLFFKSVLLSQLPLKSDLQWNGAAVGQWCKHLLELQLV